MHGDGTFAAPAQYSAGVDVKSIAIGDLDGDQVPDLAVANDSSYNVSVLLGFGDGTFAAAAHYAANRRPGSVAIGDLDGDQLPDLAVANLWSNNVSVLLNQLQPCRGVNIMLSDAGSGPNEIHEAVELTICGDELAALRRELLGIAAKYGRRYSTALQDAAGEAIARESVA